ncbi:MULTISPECIES: response regulator transcription factor [Myxococcaceae]|uniref:response regulator transcription factor n=1 Tax=Myxococcaceae TaxID=31 RepID=UPI0018906BC6|nr:MULTISPECIES: response regulator transcription factor [Myxococcaceae]MBF5046545.1 response regulator transcription factor [Simulacricoccus sp. 17bor-14]
MRTKPQPPCARVQGADAHLTALLADVLRDEGVQVAAGAAGAAPDLTLALVSRPEALPRALAHTPQAPVIVLLPFAEERLQRRALELGARGCFALGQPLEALRALVRGVLHGDFAGEAAAAAHGGETA